MRLTLRERLVERLVEMELAADRAYRRCASHWESCLRCQGRRLCRKGCVLMRLYARAEGALSREWLAA